MEPRRRVSEGDSLKRVLYWAANRPRCQKPSLFATDVTVPPSRPASGQLPTRKLQPERSQARHWGSASKSRIGIFTGTGVRPVVSVDKSWSSSGSSEPTSVGIGLLNAEIVVNHQN